MHKPIPVQRVLEVRYERGYRYLDRCGEAMLILQDLLPSESKSVWMPEDIVPAGAKLKCPELDMRVTFDATRFFLEQISNEETSLFPAIASSAFAVISARFDLRTIIRVGLRRFFMIGTDSTDKAQELSVKLAPMHDWPPGRPPELLPLSTEATSLFESEDGAVGFQFSLKPVSRIEAPEQLDLRASLPSKLLEVGQKQALIEQIKRKAQREKKPTSGVMLDLDYYHVRPDEADISTFWMTAVAAGDKIIDAALTGR